MGALLHSWLAMGARLLLVLRLAAATHVDPAVRAAYRRKTPQALDQ